MNIYQWIVVFVILNIIHGIATWKFYKKAGKQAWKAFVPFLNIYELMKIINRPVWWMIFVYIPIVNLLMIPTLWVQLLSVFGKNSTKDKILVVITLGLYLAYLNYTEVDKLPYNPSHKNDKDTLIGSLVFAIIAATIVHTFFIQPYKIPTGSLEKTLLIGDYLLVSKMHYGARVPMTTIAAPMVHDTLPVINKKSYLKFPQLPYMRIPGFQKVKRNDIVVFNWPADTVRYFFQKDVAQYKPIDKKSHYVKRCVAIAGDTLNIKHGKIYINGKPTTYPDRTYLQRVYKITTKPGMPFTRSTLMRLMKNYGIGVESVSSSMETVLLNLTDENLARIKKLSNVDKVELLDVGKGQMYGGNSEWDINNFGPLYVPKKGDKIILSPQNYLIYKDLIEKYDDHDKAHKVHNHILSRKGDEFFLDGKPIKDYTVKQNYYFMMGDNRSNSEDSRFWGFVPFDHVVGKPVFIFYSSGPEGIRWDRVFTTVMGKGERVSYLIPFLILVGFYYAFTAYRNRKKKA
jgi:signal peptidase I